MTGPKGFHDVFDRKSAKEREKAVRDRQSRRGGNFNFWKPPIGTSVFRILPPGSERLMSRGEMGKLVYKHFLRWDGKNQGIHICGMATDPDIYDQCPIDVALEQIESVTPKEMWKKQQSRPRGFWNVLVRRCAGPDNEIIEPEIAGKVVICDSPSGLYDFVQLGFNNPELGFFIDPYEGADIICTRTGKDLDTKYTYNLKPGKWTPIMETREETDELLAKLTDIDKFTRVTEDQLQKQIDAAKEILSWGRRFGAMDQKLNLSEASLGDLMNAADPPASENGSTTTEAPTTEAPKAEPEKREAPAAAEEREPSKGGPETDEKGMPVCSAQFHDKNPGSSNGKAQDPVCKACEFALPCSFEKQPG